MKTLNIAKLTFLLIAWLYCCNMQADGLFAIQNGKLVPARTFELWHDKEANHADDQYKQVGIKHFQSKDGYTYDVKAFQNKADDADIYGDTIFSKIAVTSRSPEGKTKTTTFINDDQWLKYGYWDCAYLTDYSWFINDLSVCRLVSLGDDCNALVFQGYRDAVDAEDFTVLVTYKDQVKLVYHKDNNIFDITENDKQTIFRLGRAINGEEEKPRFEFTKMTFGDRQIKVENDGQIESARIVVNQKGEEQGYYLEENKDKYHISAQDEGWISKKGMHIERYSADKGQGIVHGIFKKTANVRSTPSAQGKLIGKITFPEGELPEVYDCKGIEKGWYKIDYKGKTGWVKCDVVEWEAINLY